MYKVIVFDVYGTMFDVNSIKANFDQYNKENAGEIASLWRKTQLHHAALRQVMQRYIRYDDLTKNALRYALDVYEVKYSREDINKLFDGYLNLDYFKEIPKAFIELKNKNLELAILSNGNDNMLRTLVDNSAISEHIDAIMSVDEVKQYKPSPASYALVLKYYQVKRSEILFVSTNTWDVNGAANFGFDTAWVNRNNEIFDENGAKPTITVNNVNELVKWLELKS
ncbi:haloacid dehalogenase type II [Staphylococcus durrellii]|uniref:haloacid dehalogenase type II n=1 Tax=Staphylococcus durrellii TaxID=2781773 RepID=UPI00189EBD20|nr:haloacid dehalogenase type II [Staphylococcus durrellii]MBF7016228.1 haloacid dehalogenase type II [Staphylococcus durrellii]